MKSDCEWPHLKGEGTEGEPEPFKTKRAEACPFKGGASDGRI